MLSSTRVLTLTFFLIVGAPASRSLAFSAAGHHSIAVIAYEVLSTEEQAEIMRILAAHPRFSQDFSAPESIAAAPEAVSRWQIGVAGEWPDIIRGNRDYDRPTWHYQLGATLSIGEVNVPATPGPLPENADSAAQELHIAQAIELNKRILSDPSFSDAERAVAICWLAHLVADAHQPCHAGSLYTEKAFPEGDRGANSIKLIRGRNLHALWDGLLGTTPDASDIRKRSMEMLEDSALKLTGELAASMPSGLEPETWLEESRIAARGFVYTPLVIDAVQLVEREVAAEVPAIELSEKYLSDAGSIARIRATQASHRLARLLSNCLSDQRNLSAAPPRSIELEAESDAATNSPSESVQIKLQGSFEIVQKNAVGIRGEGKVELQLEPDFVQNASAVMQEYEEELSAFASQLFGAASELPSMLTTVQELLDTLSDPRTTANLVRIQELARVLEFTKSQSDEKK